MTRTPDSDYQWTPASVGRNNLMNVYEPLQPYFLSEFSRAAGCDVFVDVGANVGFYSVFMAGEISARGVYAFEPMAAGAAETRLNIAINNLSGSVELRQMALSSKPGTATMSVMGDLSGANSIAATSIHNGSDAIRTESVPTSTLDAELPLSGEVISVKIDVEGHELDVLNGGPDFFTKNKAVIQLENYEGDDGAVYSALKGYGYERLLSVGPDQYFSNIGKSLDVRQVTENAMARFIEASKQPADQKSKPMRWRMFRGVTLELSPRLARFVRKISGRA